MPPSQQLTIEQTISRAKKAVKQGDTTLALKLYNTVLKNQPNHPIAKKGQRKIQNELPRNQSTQAKTTNPPQDQINTLTNLYHSGPAAETEKACGELLKAYPQSPIITNILGAALQGQGKLQEAVANYDRAIQIRPNYANAYSNRGTALQEMGRLEDALESCDRAIQIKPDFADAYSNRGSALQELGRLGEASENYRKAISIIPQNGLLWAAFANCLQAVEFTSCNDNLMHDLLQMLEQPTVGPHRVSKAVISALRYYPRFLRILKLFKSNRVEEDIDHLTAQLSTIPLLLRVMELSPIADLDMERMLLKMRASMLTRVTSGREEVQGLRFYTSLAMQCFANEYVYSESEEEKQKIELLQEEVKVALEKGWAVSPTRIAVLGAYRPLSGFSWADDLLRLKWSGDIKKIVVAQIGDVRKEQALRSKIPHLTTIEDKVSQAVRNQYEENPYPRWINAGLSDNPKPIRKVLQGINVHHNLDVQQFSVKPDVLVAGCGTGQHALDTASRFLNCNVLAVDLSLSSLSYAMRKTQELGVTNIEYMQGDILRLNLLEREFDIIESEGVLHHMDDPLAGWKVLVDRLRSGGLMKVGLYSDTARQHIVKAHNYIAKKKYTTSPDNIRKFREEVINMNPNSDLEITQVVESPDFYSLSACRDLLFHVQENRFTLPQIEAALNDLNLRFLGFEFRRSWIRRSFSELYPDKDALTSLSLWHQFEIKNPRTFRGMYQFWVQKA
ncbi:tetratricopeptide repeat protein [Alphaproteobacteria bacterium]|nr:tetratricopeptide repeat protein [Alphaproteobacteria bacterium]